MVDFVIPIFCEFLLNNRRFTIQGLTLQRIRDIIYKEYCIFHHIIEIMWCSWEVNMKNTLTKILALLLVVCMLCPMIIACSKKSNNGNANTNETERNPYTGDVGSNSEKSEKDEVDISFYANGGRFQNGNESYTKKVIKGEIFTEPDTPTKEGYAFAGWSTEKNGTDIWDFSADTTDTAISLYAVWVINEYTVSFNLMCEDGTVTKPTVNGMITYVPQRENYLFNGWYTDEDLTKPWDETKVVTENGLILYAAWVEDSGDARQLTAPVISIEENVFSWKEIKGANGYTVIVSSVGSNTPEIETTIYRTSYTIPTSLDAGVYTVKIRAKGNGETTVNSPYVTRTYSLRVLEKVTGITFDINTSILSWNKVENADKYTIYFGNTPVEVGDVNTFDMSSYDAGDYSIQIAASRETWVTSRTSNFSFKKIRLNAPEVTISINPTTKAYILTWDSVSKADTYRLTFGENRIEVSERSYTISANSSLWLNNVIKVKVDAFDSDADYLVSINATEHTLKKVTELNASVSSSTAGHISISGSVWKPIYVYFDLNGATGSISAQRITTETGVEYPTVPTRSGYIFTGWYTEPDCENIYDFTKPLTESVTLYAGWYSCNGTFRELNSGKNSYTSSSSYKYIYFRALSDSQLRFSFERTSSSGTTYVRLYDVTDGKEVAPEFSKSGSGTFSTSFYPAAGHIYYMRIYSTSSITLYYSITTYPSNTFLPDDGGMAVADYYLAQEAQDASNYVLCGETYTLTAYTDDDRYIFAGWYDGDTCLGNELTYQVTMGTDNQNIVAKWVYYTVTIEKNISEAGSISSNKDIVVGVGNSVTITATTNSGYTWDGWYNGETKLTDETSYTFTMTETDVTYTAKWVYYTVTTSSNLDGAGSYTQRTDYKVTVGKSTTITASTYSGYTWLGWYDGDTKLTDSLSYTFTMPAENVTYTAKWIKVTLERNDTSAGTVTNLSSKYKVGDEVTITASTNSGYTWVGWYDGDTKLTDSLSYTFTMPAENVTYTAKWITRPVTVEKNISAAGSVSGVPSTSVVGQQVTITASTNSGYTWLGWYNGNTKLTDELSYTFVMPTDEITYTAKWTYYTITTNTDLSAAGSYTQRTNYKVTVGQSVTLTATPNTGYTFVGWYDGETKLSENSSYTFTMPAENIAYTAKWTYYTLTTNTSLAEGGSYTQRSDYKVTAGSSTTITATTNNGYTFVGWFNGETKLSGDLSYTFAMPATNVTYTAKWIECPVTLQKNISEAGSISSLPSKSSVGDEITVTATTQSGYTFVGWYDGDTKLSGDLSYTFTMPAENVTYTAKWIKVTVAANNSAAGSITSLTSKYTAGQEITVTATTNSGYTFVGWFNGETKLTSELSYTFTMPEENVTYTARWIKVTIATNISAAGTVTSLTSTYKAGQEITVTATTNRGYTFVGWYDGDVCLTEELNHTFCMPNGNARYTARFALNSEMSNFNFTSTADTCLITSIKKSTVNKIIIPNYVTSIEENAFCDCTELISITIGNSVTSIGSDAFKNCNKLVEVYNLSSLNITKGSSNNGRVGYYALDIYISIESVSKLDTTTDGYIFYSNGNKVYLIGYTGVDTQLTLPNSYNNVNYQVYEYAFYSCNKINSITFSNNITSIGECAFANSTNLQSVTIGTSVTSIGNSAFANCTKLSSVKIGNSVKSIGDSAFYCCTSLTSVTLPNSIESIGNSAFLACPFTRITIPNYVTTIGSKAFYNCTELSSVTIGSSVKSIGNYAFYYCTSLKSITIPSSVNRIGKSVFSGCTNLANITFADTSTWCYTTTQSNWEYSTGGTQFDVTNTANNATWFTGTQGRYSYWYKK